MEEINTLIKTYRQELGYFLDHIKLEEIAKVFRLFKECKGIIFFSGVGKSALIAEKIAMTMTSTGTRALFLTPIEAMHGDIGLLTNVDLFVAVSKSGETDELLNLVPYVRNKGANIISFVSKEASRLEKASDCTLHLPVQKELCPHNMAPTISTTAQLIVGDLLAVALMKARNFSLNEYAMNHPAGTIGKRITVKVSDLMLRDKLIPVCAPQDKLIDTLVELSDKKAGCVLIVDKEKKLQGIFTDGDLRRALQQHGPAVLDKKMGDLMVTTARTIGSESLAWDAMKLMESNQRNPFMVMPVIDKEKRVLGLIKMHDILQSGI